MAIFRRNKHFYNYMLSAASFVWLARKRQFMLSGMIEEDLSRVTTAKIGSLKDPQYDVPSLLSRLYRYKKSLTYSIFTQRDSSTLARICMAIDDLETDVSDGTLRKQPFCVLLYGYPGTGKSSFAIQIAQALMTDKYGEFNSADMVTLNESDEYQSEFRTSHKVVLFDDIGASKYGLNDTKNPWRKVVDFVNNIKKTALNPNVEMKGKVYIQPDLVILTSNLDFENGGQINGYIPAFEAIMRRLSKIVRVVNHTTVNPLDPASDPSPDLGSYLTHKQEYRLRGAVGSMNKYTSSRPTGFREPTRVPRADYIQELRNAYKKHDANQTSFVNYFNSYFDDHTLEDSNALDSQSGEPIELSFAHLTESRIQYYTDNVNWPRYYIEYCAELDGNGYYLTPHRTIVTYDNTHQMLCVHVDEFNEAFRRYFNSLPDTGIVAESYDSGNISQEFPIIDFHVCVELFEKHELSIRTLRQLISVSQQALGSWQDWEKLSRMFPTNVGLTTRKKWNKAMKHGLIVGTSLMDSLLRASVYVVAGEACAEQFQVVLTLAMFTLYKPLTTGTRYERAIRNYNRFIHPSEVFSCFSIESCHLSVSSLPSTSSRLHSSELISEEESIERLCQLLPNTPLQIYRNLNFGNFGEIDLVYKFNDYIIVAEVKRTAKSSSKNLGRNQAIKYSKVIEILQPNVRVFGMFYSFSGLEVVLDNGIPYESNSLDALFQLINYEKL